GEGQQDNELTLSRNAVVAAETRAILDLNHDFMLKQMGGTKLNVGKLMAPTGVATAPPLPPVPKSAQAPAREILAGATRLLLEGAGRPDFDPAVPGHRVRAGDLDRFRKVGALEQVEPDDQLLGLRERAVGDERLAVADAHGPRLGRRGEFHSHQPP